jgi:SAM-dependent methyltransferase
MRPGAGSPESLRSLEALQDRIVSRGCYSRAENRRIFDKWFKGTRPRDRLFSALDRRYELTRGTVCDIGCGYGSHLVLCSPGSFGLDLESYQTDFGLELYERDVITDDLEDLPTVDAVWCGAVIEHVDSPHIFLRKIHGLLKPGGRLVLETPRKPSIPLLEKLPVLRRLFSDHDDHISAFTESTLCFTCERAGFRTLATHLWSKPLAQRLSLFSPFATGVFPLSLIANGVVYVGEKIEPWDYGPSATRRAAVNRRGYVLGGPEFPEQPRQVVAEGPHDAR